MTKPNPRRVASRYTKRGGIIQAPPEMVEAVSAWVMSSVAATRLKSLRQKVKELQADIRGRKELSPFIAEAKRGASGGMGVRALYDLTIKSDNNLWSQAIIKGWNDRDAFSYRIKFKDFSKQYKEGNTWLLGKLASMEEFVDGKDWWTTNRVSELREAEAEFKGFLVPGGKRPIPSGGASKVFDVSKYMKGWRYADILTDPGRIRRSQLIQTQQQLKWFLNLDAGRKVFPAEIEDLEGKVEALSSGSSGGEMAFKDVTVNLSFAGVNTPKASWTPIQRVVTVYYPAERNVGGRERIDSLMVDLVKSVRHELQHMAQTMLSETYQVTNAGLPQKDILTPTFKQWMNQPEEWFRERSEYLKKHREVALQKLREEGAIDPTIRGRRIRTDPRKIDFHALDDIEFFTRLQDSIEEAQRATRGLSGDVRDNALDIWTGVIKRPEMHDYPHTGAWSAAYEELGGYDALKDISIGTFFKALKNVPSTRKKYQRALKEFRKELGYRGSNKAASASRVAARYQEAVL